ncbi:MAG: translation initiation factor [Bacteroidota bacterium]|nr:translation initiation factor [Bacteroidota bacterium]
MAHQKTLTSLSDLEQLLPGTERNKPQVQNIPSRHKHDGKGMVVRVLLDKKGRKGKIVTIVSGLQHNPSTMEEIARILKQYCGAGGTVKERRIEIQGDNRTRVIEKLKKMNYNP